MDYEIGMELLIQTPGNIWYVFLKFIYLFLLLILLTLFNTYWYFICIHIMPHNICMTNKKTLMITIIIIPVILMINVLSF